MRGIDGATFQAKSVGAVATAESLPEWNLTHLYPGMDSPGYAADLAALEPACRGFAEQFRGKIAEVAHFSVNDAGTVRAEKFLPVGVHYSSFGLSGSSALDMPVCLRRYDPQTAVSVQFLWIRLLYRLPNFLPRHEAARQ